MAHLLIRGSEGPEVQRLLQALEHQLGADAQRFGALGLAKGRALDADAQAAIRRWQAGVGLVADGVIGPHCQFVLGLRAPGALALPMSVDAVRRLFPATKPANIERYLPYVAAALEVMGLTDRAMILAALGTIRAESEGFVPISEMPSQFNTLPGESPFSAYDQPRKHLGNVRAGDGARFKGRGFVQLTGRANYEKYGHMLGIDLDQHPDLANAPEVAALLLARFLADRATAMRQAIAEGHFADARKLVNGGTHGLDRFRQVFTLAEAIWPSQTAEPAGPKLMGIALGQGVDGQQLAQRTLNVCKDPGDLKDRPYLPPPIGLQAVFPSDPDVARFLPNYARAGLVLDQGQEGACTGFGLACVVNYLRWSKAGYPAQMASVSPRMLYNFARRYDEYAGENYEGSSCRGALKGWFNHGVCLEQDWPYSAETQRQPKYGYAQRAAANTLGVYYRVDLKSITDMHAAIQAVGAVYVSAFTHRGWHELQRRSSPASGHKDLPAIAFDGRPSETNGHAFALVGFNERGFVVQNSWGGDWGAQGFAVLSYEDWLANAMDAWVVATGVPGVVVGRVSRYDASGAQVAGGADQGRWWSEDQAYQHSVVLGNDGRVKRYLTEDELSRTLLYQVAGLPDQWFRTQGGAESKRLVIYAHGGLNSEGDAIQRARAMGRHFLGNDCYPLFMVWKTGLLESLGHIVQDAMRKQPALAGGVQEWLSEKSDMLIEKMIGRPLARPIWSEMKENAELGFDSGRGGDLLVTALQKLVDSWGDALEIHLIGHSAGAILLGHLLSALAARGLSGQVKSIHLYAPACTVQFANRHYAPHADLMKRMHLQLLSDRVERNDNVMAVYRKSLLYFVSNALEVDLRTPIVGLENVFNEAYGGWDGTSSTCESLKTWRQAAASAGLTKPGRMTVLSSDKVVTALPHREIDASHGSFDNDVTAMNRTLESILGAAPATPVDDLRGF